MPGSLGTTGEYEADRTRIADIDSDNGLIDCGEAVDCGEDGSE